jgi:hypothetical protein
LTGSPRQIAPYREVEESRLVDLHILAKSLVSKFLVSATRRNRFAVGQKKLFQSWALILDDLPGRSQFAAGRRNAKVPDIAQHAHVLGSQFDELKDFVGLSQGRVNFALEH